MIKRNVLISFIVIVFAFLCRNSSASTTILNDYNPWDVQIQDNGTSVNSDLSLFGAPSDAKITKVEIYYEIKHQRPSDLDVWLTCYDNGWQDDYTLHTQGNTSSVDRINVENIHIWDGKSPNVTWYLVARDNVTGITGYIDFFELWVTCETNDPPNTPSSQKPEDGATNVSITTDLSWSCSDPNGDTLYYTVYFEKNDSSPDNTIKNDSTGANADPGTLDYDSDYYWRVKADDHKGGVTWSDVWNFYTKATPVIDASIIVNAISSVQAGSTVTIPYTVTNDGNVSHAFGVGAEIWKDGVKQDDIDTHTTPNVSPGSTTSASFTYDIPPGWSGTYVARCAVWSGTPGSSTWLGSFDRNFTVVIASLPSLSGRIAFHRDSNNLLLHTPSTPDDGHIYIFRLDEGIPPSKVTSGLALGNAMNPHFSPDGAKLTFMAIPSGQTLSWNNMRVYVLDLADNIPPSNLGSGQDPKFSPDGNFIVFKRNNQICRMRCDGSEAVTLTNSAGEKSGPNYSPEGSKIVYWLNGNENADIWLMNADGSGAVPVVENTSIQDYYPIYRDNNNILYAQWDSPTKPHPDKIYNLEISSGISTRLGLNSDSKTVEDADAFPVSDLIGFSSTRKNGWPDYDLYIAADGGSPFGEISAANSSLGELGGVYSRYTFARKIVILNPTNGASLEISSTYLLKVRAYSDGAIWASASPSVTFFGPVIQTYTGLNDSGSSGDQIAGDGIYSKTITLPSETGAYSVTANAISLDNGLENNIVSVPITVTLFETTRIIRLSGDLTFGDVTIGQTAQKTLTIWNDGNSTLNISGINYPTGFSGDWSGSIVAGESKDVKVTFSPQAVQNYGGDITVNSDKTSGTYTMACSGMGVVSSTRVIRLSGDLAFDDLTVGQTSQKILTIWNDGNSTLNISGITYPTGFSGNWSGSIVAGESKDIKVTFLPQAVQNYGGDIIVSSDKTSGTYTIACSGSGVAISNCTDNVDCTDDSYDEVNDVCVYTANDLNCDDGNTCTDNICDPINGCNNPEIENCYNKTTPKGDNITIELSEIGFEIWFESVGIAGVTTVFDDSTSGPELPPNFNLAGNYYDISTTADFNGHIQVCINYDDSSLQGPEEDLKLLHYNTIDNPNHWEETEDKTLDTTNNIICGFVNHLSPFAAASPSPCSDVDGDNFFAKSGCGTEVDCNDNDPNINPNAAEKCDGVDNNCDGQIDEGCSTSSSTQVVDDSGSSVGRGCSVVPEIYGISTGTTIANALIFFLPFIIFGIGLKRHTRNRS